MSVYSTYMPRAPLADFVESLWLYESTTSPPHARERRLPSGSVELVINLREDVVSVNDRQDTNKLHSFRAGVISGPYSTFFVIETSGLSSLIGVAFKPGGAAPFLPFPVAELQNRQVSLETLWGAPAFELRDRLLAVETPRARFSILEQWLLTRARRPLLWRPTLTFALAELHTTQTISEVVEQTGLSSRRFIQIFHEAVGLTPKQFSRVKRFQEVLRLAEKGEQIVWADIALSCGYYDQAHVTFLRILFPILRIKRRCIMVVEMQKWQAFSHKFSRLTLTPFHAPESGANGVFGTNKKSSVRKMTPPRRPLQPPMRNFM